MKCWVNRPKGIETFPNDEQNELLLFSTSASASAAWRPHTIATSLAHNVDLFVFIFGYEACPSLLPDISQPLNNKSDTLGASLTAFSFFRQLNGPVMSSRSHGMTGPQRGGGLGGGWETWLSLAWHCALPYKLSPGATLHSFRQLRLRSRLTYLQQYFFIPGWNGRVQIIVIMFSGYCRDDYVRYGSTLLPTLSVYSPTPYLWATRECFQCRLELNGSREWACGLMRVIYN